MSTSEGYILNAVQTAGPLFPVYQSITRGQESKEEVISDTGLSEEQCEPALQGLQLLRLIGRDEYDLYAADLVWESGDRKLDFRMSALHNLANECKSDDWGKQAVVLLIHRYLIENDIQYFTNNDQGLYESIDNWYRRELGYDPQSSQGSITLNDPKFGNWARIAAYLGIIEKTNGREHTLYIDPDLVHRSITLAADGREFIPIREYITWLNENLLQLGLTGDGRIPTSLSRILYTLVREGYIRLIERGDEGAIGLNGIPSRDGIEAEANTIEVRT